jgi:RND family efflux transporter MFP subunit
MGLGETGSSGNGVARKRPSPLWLMAGAGALAGGFLLMQVAGSTPPPQGDAVVSDTLDLVETMAVDSGSGRFLVRAPGRLEPRQELTLVGEVPGKVVEMHPNLIVGGRIPKGAVILRIDPEDYSAELSRANAQVATARARLEQATAERDRQVRLSDSGAAPARAKEAAIATYEDAAAALLQAEAATSVASRGVVRSTLRAPYDAIVVQETVSIGGYVAPGLALARMIEAGEGQLVAGLSPQDVRAVRAALATAPDGRLSVRAVPNSGSIGTATLNGELRQFSPVIDAVSRTVSVVAVFPDAFKAANDGKVFAGDFMTLEVDARSDVPVLRVPASAVRRDAWVWTVTRTGEGSVPGEALGTLHRADVTRVDRDGDWLLVTSDVLKSGDTVSVTLLSEEAEGRHVRVREARR